MTSFRRFFLPLLAVWDWHIMDAEAFVVTPPTFGRRRRISLRSSVGGGDDGPPPSDPEGGNSQWDDFFREESDNLRKAREYMSENALPLNYDLDEDVQPLANQTAPQNSSALVRKTGFFANGSNPDAEALANNPYLQVVSKLSPSEMISKFTSSAHPRVQNAVRSTILSLIGGLPKMAFDTTTITTGQRLASLMFQLQMTGYMFKNADYRLSLQQSLGGFGDSENFSTGNFLLSGDASTDEKEEIDPLAGKVKGKIRVRYGTKEDSKNDDDTPQRNNVNDGDDKDDDDDDDEASETGVEMEVDAAAYMSELCSEVSQLRDELIHSRKEKEEALRKDLLVYIRTLPEKELRELSGSMSPDVLVAMKGLVNAVMSGIGEGQIGPDTVTEQSGEAMAQLCMWQLVVGYNLRTLEVREEMKKSLTGSFRDPGESESEADIDTGLGAFE